MFWLICHRKSIISISMKSQHLIFYGIITILFGILVLFYFPYFYFYPSSGLPRNYLPTLR
nr:hypothetical protein [uncultured bacterium]